MKKAITKLLIANRGEIAIRVARAASEMGIGTVAIYSPDDAQSLHTRMADSAVEIAGAGAAAYLDGAAIVAAAREAGCDAVHPGYGFLSENTAFASVCGEAGLTFVGPRPETLVLFGDKAQARRFAEEHEVPVTPGTSGPTTLEQARAFMTLLGPHAAIMVKALAGGGGRGMRVVADPDQLATTMERCRSEALQSFGNGDVYVERLFPRPRHIEVQIIGDGTGAVTHLWERDCSIQRERQKISRLRRRRSCGLRSGSGCSNAAAAPRRSVQISGARHLRVPGRSTDASDDAPIAFIEANARLQVEHTVTEEVTGLDLVKAQLEIASGATLGELKLRQQDIPAPRGIAIQARVNLETMQPDGSVRGSGGVISVYEPPCGPRRAGRWLRLFRLPHQSALRLAAGKSHHACEHAKFADAAAKAERALSEFRIAGVPTNIPFLRALLRDPRVLAGEGQTRFIDEHAAELVAAQPDAARYFEPQATVANRRAGAKLETTDPLGVVNYGRSRCARPARS